MTEAPRPTKSAGRQHQSVEQRTEIGRAARADVPRSSHRDWTAASGRPDPVRLLEEQNESRIPWLVPLRHARMRVSPFTFYRGTARIMAGDLAGTPDCGLTVQVGGDAHLSNFGAYASPSRQLVFDANDFDETLPGPWEWDVKRLATSFLIAGQHLGFTPGDSRKAASRAVNAYREAMARFASMGFLDLWYEHMTVGDIRATGGMNSEKLEKRLSRFERKAESRDNLQALAKIAERAWSSPRPPRTRAILRAGRSCVRGLGCERGRAVPDPQRSTGAGPAARLAR